MATKTFLSVAEYVARDEPAGVRYELSEGELTVSPSANLFHNEIRDEFNGRLRVFVKARKLGRVVSEMDFQLGEDTVRRPDIASSAPRAWKASISIACPWRSHRISRSRSCHRAIALPTCS